MAGRKPKPISVKTGKISKADIKQRTEAEIKLQGDIDKLDKAPNWLSKEGKKIYKEILNEVKNSGLNICNLDIYSLATLANALDMMIKCQKTINQEGMLINYTNKGGNENIIEHPCIKTYVKFEKIFSKMCTEMGMSPTSRAKLSLIQLQSKQDEEDPLLKILSDDSD